MIVTGASRGIGRSIAEQFAAEGAKVACIATTEANANATAQAIGGKGYGVNIADSEAVQATFDQIIADLGTPSVLVCNAGITRDTLLLRMKDEDWAQVLNINLTGTYNCIKAVTKPMMKATYGRVITIGSIVGLGGAAGQANYAAAKAGLIGLTKSVAKELGSRNITANCVAPGFIETDMTAELSAEMRESVLKGSPVGRLGEGADIANAVLFLANPKSSFITGQVLVVDGGLTI